VIERERRTFRRRVPRKSPSPELFIMQIPPLLGDALARLQKAVSGQSPLSAIQVSSGDLATVLTAHGVDPAAQPALEPGAAEAPFMTDDELLALCIWTEARGEPAEGKAAVARVIFNRMAAGYFSDGTVAGTVLRYDQFSAFWFDMVGGRYTRAASSAGEARGRAVALLPGAMASASWAACVQACADGAIGSAYAWGPQGQRLAAEPRALLYCDLAVSHPIWATPQARVAAIFNHTFFRA
jgi:spore germination cell wall hydrolase CwlJ-like protein